MATHARCPEQQEILGLGRFKGRIVMRLCEVFILADGPSHKSPPSLQPVSFPLWEGGGQPTQECAQYRTLNAALVLIAQAGKPRH